MTRPNWFSLLILTSIVTPLVLLLVASIVRQVQLIRRAADRWNDRVPVADREFLRRCRIPDELVKVDVALAVRRAVARQARVPAEMIKAEDRIGQDLAHLFWDGLDPVELIMEIEEELDLTIPDSVGFDACTPAGGYHAELRVEHVVRAVVGAVCQPRKAVFDEDW